MRGLLRHISACMVAGIVALLPIGGAVFTVVWLEWTISETWLADQPWYFPGMGLLAVLVAMYVVGLVVTTFIGRWAWRVIDRLLEGLPLLGQLYATLKQVLGYGEGEGALFQKVVLVRDRSHEGYEIGLVTLRMQEPDGSTKLAVFIPGSPNPGAGRLVMLPEDGVRPTNIAVSDALKTLVAVGATPLEPGAGSGEPGAGSGAAVTP